MRNIAAPATTQTSIRLPSWDSPPPPPTIFAILARRSARQQRRAVEVGDPALARIFASITAGLLDQHLAAMGRLQLQNSVITPTGGTAVPS